LAHSYEIYSTYGDEPDRSYHRFTASCLSGALDVARKDLKMDRGRLYEDGHPVCYLKLIESTGVWLVGATGPTNEDL